MRSPTYLVIGIAFILLGVLTCWGILFPNLPSAGHLRLMIGLVFILMGVHRGVLAFFPRDARPHRPGSHAWPREKE